MAAAAARGLGVRVGAAFVGVGFALAVGGSADLSAQIDPFYVEVEREAQTALARGESVAAARLYRVACFGMLDEPARLAACIARLAKAQEAAKDLEGFEASYLRLATVEERFQGLSRSTLSLAEKQELARLAAARLRPETVAQIPALAELVAADQEKAAEASAGKALPPPKRSKRRDAGKAPEAPGAPAGESASTAEAQSGEPNPGESVEVEAPAPADFPKAGSPPALAAAPDQDRLDAARRRVAERPERPVVEAELEAVRAIADRSPGDTAAARLAGDLAYLLGSWPVCADYYERAGDPGPEQPLGRFYMAVCFFETGERERAAALLAPSAARLKRSPFVDSYLSRILGTAASP